MDVFKMIAELQAEKRAVDEALLFLERLAMGQGKRRGRPPKLLALAASLTSKTRKPFSEATKRKMAASQRKRWAAARKAKSPS